ncbi:putative HTH-type transcriptional regulator [Dictyobacter vulcani]|uniref:Putative HTH-type transcriptional regulator n=1 Tax=Dictyobacter vulcani TaxID=2607529 RepID=A0A5J4KBN3_9CHLR|nr:MerR family transcriptional regulator [Dictyobacter vulcani]GER85958.1 putative HTH-type transcriptional regulator [Dictyobacter vulcani]
MEDLTISQVAGQAGIRPSAIRYYESINVLPPPRRVSGQRRYDAAVIDQLTFIQIAQKLGFTLTEIQLLFQNRDAEVPLSDFWQGLAQQKLTEVDKLIQQALGIRKLLVRGLNCHCPNLHDCINCVLTNCHGSPPHAAKNVRPNRTGSGTVQQD